MPMTPEEFAAGMRQCDAIPSEEESHKAADALMMALLESLGYGEGVEVFRKMFKWYA